ncbi:MAG: hypothetical protein ACTSVZ_00045 [Promethearchaeota archaeon]
MTGNSQIMIALDSNVFRNVRFIDYLILHKTKLNIALPVIVQLEVGYFYRLKGLSWADFRDEMSKFNCQFLDWQISQPKKIILQAYRQKDRLPFRDHIRDFLIGMQSQNQNRRLITYNLSHFKWLNKYSAITPEDLIMEIEKNNTEGKKNN